MRVLLAVCVNGLALLSSGCTLIGDGARVLATRTHQALDDCQERQRDQRLAAAAWEEVLRTDPGLKYSPDYVRGFREGYAEYLYAGGSGEPPLVPPRRYQGPRYQNVEGYQAAQDWFAGYRHGAAAARQSGLRQWMTVSVSLPSAGAPLPPPAPVVPTPQEELPAPREQPPVRARFLPLTAPVVPAPQEEIPARASFLPLSVENVAEPETSPQADPLTFQPERN
jgi:hypothetical protein